MDLRIKVIPKSAKTGLAEILADGTWRVRVAAPPEKGKANLELCEWLAKHLGVPKSKVRILSGKTSAIKRLRIDP